MSYITSQSSGHRFRIWHFEIFRVSYSVSANLFKVVVLINFVVPQIAKYK